jgi:hypothetical protein
MQMFAFDPADYRERYAEKGWVHVQGGVTPEFLGVLQAFTREQFGAHAVEGKAIGGTKSQALFECPPGADFPGELFDVIAELCGLQRETMTLSERHIKAYDRDAPARPSAHKDRYASQVSVGLSIDIPKGSHLVLYPEDDVWINPYNVSAALPQSLEPHEHPDVALENARGIEIHDSEGDVVLFRGSAMWHLRRNAANTTNLYLKMNDFNCDPLGEDPNTPVRRERTLAAVRNGRAGLGPLVPVLSRRLDLLSRQYTRDWQEVLEASVWDEPPVRLSALAWDILQAIDGRESVNLLAGRFGNHSRDVVEAELLRLAERGVIELPG